MIRHGHCLGGRVTKEYKSWSAMKGRCYLPSYENFPRYGGRGVKVCDRWMRSFDNFIEDMGLAPYGFTLDRKDPNGDYSKENCRWASRATQQQNLRITKVNWDDVTSMRNRHEAGEVTYADLAKEYGISPHTVCGICRYKHWKVESEQAWNS